VFTETPFVSFMTYSRLTNLIHSGEWQTILDSVIAFSMKFSTCSEEVNQVIVDFVQGNQTPTFKLLRENINHKAWNPSPLSRSSFT
jgi:hypothetical protein